MTSRVKRSIVGRAIPVGDVIGINGYRVSLEALKLRFFEGGYTIQETLHFLVFTRETAPSTIIVHWFPPEAIDATLGNYLMQELKPLGILSSEQALGDIFGAIVGSIAPYNLHAWHTYTLNTLNKYRHLITHGNCPPLSNSNMEQFSCLYKRVMTLRTGTTFLDAGCSYGFLPLLMADRFPDLTDVVGVDIRSDSFSVISTIATEQQLTSVHFEQADLLDESFPSFGCFDTVTALHVLEHFTEADMYCVLTNLLGVTTQRLILAVPYENEREIAYGHKQLFDREKLKAVGMWCVQQLNGQAHMSYEDCSDGLLVIERHRDRSATLNALATFEYKQQIY